MGMMMMIMTTMTTSRSHPGDEECARRGPGRWRGRGRGSVRRERAFPAFPPPRRVTARGSGGMSAQRASSSQPSATTPSDAWRQPNATPAMKTTLTPTLTTSAPTSTRCVLALACAIACRGQEQIVRMGASMNSPPCSHQPPLQASHHQGLRHRGPYQGQATPLLTRCRPHWQPLRRRAVLRPTPKARLYPYAPLRGHGW